jgi:hypothetical protein
MSARQLRTILLVGLLSAFRSQSTQAEETSQPTSTNVSVASEKAQAAAERALAFLVDDAAKWRKERGCATCHHGCMTVWALSESKSQGYAVNAEALIDTVEWTKDLFVPQFSKPRDHRWGFNFFSLPGIYLSLMSQTLPVLSRDEVHRMAVHLERHQEDDGVWQLPPANPNTAPPTLESAETIALLALLAWEPNVSAVSNEGTSNRAARERAVAWLEKAKPTETVQALSLRLLLDMRKGDSLQQLSPRIDQLMRLQNADGGWSQLPNLPSDAYATGQVLWILSFLKIPSDHPQVSRAVAFLVASQQENGSWPMIPRSLPDADPAKPRYPVPIIYFGTAWATLGLVRFVPAMPAPDTIQQRAFDAIRGYSGTYEVDQGATGKPVVSVKLRYEIDDKQLANLVRLLRGFPELKSLQLMSPHITDSGLSRLTALTQLRDLSLEQSAITDAGLSTMKALTSLETLNLKGTKVTDTGVEDFQRTLPSAKVQR